MSKRITLTDSEMKIIVEALTTVRNRAMDIVGAKPVTEVKYKIAEMRIDEILLKLRQDS